MSDEFIRNIAKRNDNLIYAIREASPESIDTMYEDMPGFFNQFGKITSNFQNSSDDQKFSDICSTMRYLGDRYESTVGIKENGKTERTRTLANMSITNNNKSEDSLTERTRIIETSLTKRAQINAKTIALGYESEITKMRLVQDGIIHVSDNELEATRIKTSAYERIAIVTEELKQATRMGLEKMELEKRLAELQTELQLKYFDCQLAFYSGINKRDIENDKNIKDLIVAYIHRDTQIGMEYARTQVELELALIEERVKNEQEITLREKNFSDLVMGISNKAMEPLKKGEKYILRGKFGNTSMYFEISRE